MAFVWTVHGIPFAESAAAADRRQALLECREAAIRAAAFTAVISTPRIILCKSGRADHAHAG